MSKNIKKAAVFLFTVITAVLILTFTVSAMGQYPSESVAEYTDNEELKEKILEAVDMYPEAFLDENGEGIEYGGATDCMAYARWLYDHLFGVMDFQGINTPGYNREFSFKNGTINKTLTPEQIRQEYEALGLKFGSMVFYDPSVGSQAEHAMILLSFNENTATFIHGSWGGKGLIRVTEFTWEEMLNNFGQLAWARTPWDYPEEQFIQIKALEISGADGVFSGSTQSYKAKIFPLNATVPSVMWSVENVTGKAEINALGELTAIKKGIVRVTATARDSSGLSYTKTVRIGEPTDIINVTVATKGMDTLVLKWMDCPLADGYTVYRSDRQNGAYTPIATVSDSTTPFFEDKVAYGQTYYYKICSYQVNYGILTTGEKCLFVPAGITIAPDAQAPKAVSEINSAFLITQ